MGRKQRRPKSKGQRSEALRQTDGEVVSQYHLRKQVGSKLNLALLPKLFSDDFLSDEIKRRRREMFIVTDCTSFTVFPNEQNALHFAHSEGTRESAVYYKHSAATRLFRCAPTSRNPKGTFAPKSESTGNRFQRFLLAGATRRKTVENGSNCSARLTPS